VLRLAFLTLLAACGSSSLQYYSDNDKPIGNGGADGGSCTAIAFAVTPVAPSVQFMIDHSGTMFSDTIGGTQKFTAVKNALTGTTGVVTTLQAKADFGVSIYTSGGSCPKFYASPCAINNLAGINAAISSSNGDNNLYDPLAEALTSMVTSFGGSTGMKKTIVLATDDPPYGCNSNGGNTTDIDNSITEATALYNLGVSLYVIGLGNGHGDGNWTPFLQHIANAGVGSTANVTYYTANSQAELLTAYQTILGSVVNCEMTLDGTIDPNQASLGIVKSDTTMLTFTTDWTVVDTHTIKLVGQACTNYNAATTPPEITATFTCGATRP
jgi:hypothetical protein